MTRPEGYPHNVCPCRQKKSVPNPDYAEARYELRFVPARRTGTGTIFPSAEPMPRFNKLPPESIFLCRDTEAFREWIAANAIPPIVIEEFHEVRLPTVDKAGAVTTKLIYE